MLCCHLLTSREIRQKISQSSECHAYLDPVPEMCAAWNYSAGLLMLEVCRKEWLDALEPNILCCNNCMLGSTPGTPQFLCATNLHTSGDAGIGYTCKCLMLPRLKLRTVACTLFFPFKGNLPGEFPVHSHPASSRHEFVKRLPGPAC